MLPFYSITFIHYAFIIKEGFKSVIILTLIPLIISLLIKAIIIRSVRRKLKRLLYNIPFTKELIQLKPELTFNLAIMIRVLYLPLGLKEYLISIMDFPLLPNISSSMIIYLGNSILFTCIGLNLSSFEEILQEKTTFLTLPFQQ
jgi:hypothetical protein